MTPKMPPTTIIRMMIAIINSMSENPCSELEVVIAFTLVPHHHAQIDWRRIHDAAGLTAYSLCADAYKVGIGRRPLVCTDDLNVPPDVIGGLKRTRTLTRRAQDVVHEVIVRRIRLGEIYVRAAQRSPSGSRADLPGRSVAIGESGVFAADDRRIHLFDNRFGQHRLCAVPLIA